MRFARERSSQGRQSRKYIHILRYTHVHTFKTGPSSTVVSSTVSASTSTWFPLLRYTERVHTRAPASQLLKHSCVKFFSPHLFLEVPQFRKVCIFFSSPRSLAHSAHTSKWRAKKHAIHSRDSTTRSHLPSPCRIGIAALNKNTNNHFVVRIHKSMCT